jgi:hypothetical protein
MPEVVRRQASEKGMRREESGKVRGRRRHSIAWHSVVWY